MSDAFTDVVQENGFTEEQQAEYINNDGQFCPFCEGGDLEKHEESQEDYGSNNVVTCQDCGKSWVEVMVLQIGEIYVRGDNE